MNSQEFQTFQQALGFVEAGNKLAANALFTSLRQAYTINPDILFWCAFTSNDLNKAREAIGLASSVEPDHPDLAKVEEWLAVQEQARWGNEWSRAKPTPFVSDKRVTVHGVAINSKIE